MEVSTQFEVISLDIPSSGVEVYASVALTVSNAKIKSIFIIGCTDGNKESNIIIILILTGLL